MTVRPWMKYAGAGLAGLIVGAGAAGSGEQTRTVTAPAQTVSRTVTVAPNASRLAELRANVASERSTLRRLTRSVTTIKKNTVAGTGTFLVGADIQPGTYRAAAQHGCYWARLASLDTSDIIDNDNADGPVVVQVLASDKAFQTVDCASFRKVS